MISAIPGSTFTANLQSAPTGLVGTITVAIYDPISAVYPTPAQTISILEEPAGSGLYFATLTAPTVAGTYSVIWDNAGVVIEEDLVVTYTLPGNGDLTTLAAAKSQLKKKTETGDDAILSALITTASQEITTYCQRQFVPDPGNPVTHRFRSTNRLVDLAPYDLQAASAVVANPQDDSPATLAEWDDYELLPVDGSGMGMGTYYQLKLIWRPGGRVIIDVTGTWGAAAIPAAVSKACDITVATWFRADVAAFSTTFSPETGVVTRPKVLPDVACGLLDPYRRILL